jgi:hypothetical protein
MCMTVGQWIRINSISSIGANQLESTLALWGLGGTQVGPGGAALWAQVDLPCPLASLVHVYHHFGLFLVYFLHTNNSTSTSVSR